MKLMYSKIGSLLARFFKAILLTWISTISNKQQAKRCQVDVLVVLLGQQRPVHVSRLHDGH